MPTTIQVREVTKQRLDLLKERMNASTYDEIVSRLAGEKLGGPSSMFGAYKDLKPWTKADRGDSKYGRVPPRFLRMDRVPQRD